MAEKYGMMIDRILSNVGGSENLQAATHCMTRLRLTIKDMSKVADGAVKEIDGVLGTNAVGNQYQIIIGAQVSSVYEEFCRMTGLGAGNVSPEDTPEEKQKLTPKAVVDNVLDVVSSCVTPLIPIITAAGLVKLIVAILGPSMLNLVPETSNFMRLLTLVGDAGFYFFPVYVGYGAAKKFGCSIPLSLFFAGIMLHPSLTEIVANGESFTVYGIPMTLVTYSSNFISILLTVWIFSYIEKFLLNHIPNSLRALLHPLLSTLCMLPLMLCLLGPVGSWLGQGIAFVIDNLYSFAGPIAIGIVCALWPLLVSTGMHQALIAIAMGNIAVNGFDQSITVGGFLSSYPVIALCIVYIIQAKKKDRAQAVTNFITLAAGGVSEPAIFGMLLKYKKTILYMMIGGFAAGVYAGLMGVRTYLFGSANVLAALSFAGEYTPSLIHGIIGAGIGFVVTFVIAFIFGIYDKDDRTDKTDDIQNENLSNPSVSDNEIVALADGKMIDVSSVPDPTFAKKMMGESTAFIYEGDSVTLCAPANGQLSALFPTGHAFGITMNNGVEVLVHCGVNTVDANGDGFTVLDKKQDDFVKAGDPIVKVDLKKLRERFDMSTMLIITDDAGQNLTFIEPQEVKRGQSIVNG